VPIYGNGERNCIVINGNVNPSTERNAVPIIPSRAFSFNDEAVAVVNEEDGDDDNTEEDDVVGLAIMTNIARVGKTRFVSCWFSVVHSSRLGYFLDT